MIVMRRFSASTSFANPRIVLWFCKYTSKSLPSLNKDEGTSDQLISAGKSDLNFRSYLGAQGSPSFWQNCSQLNISQIEVVDSDAWSVSSCLAPVSKAAQEASQSRLIGLEEVGDGVALVPKHIENDPDIDDVEDLRIRGKLFYKVEQRSMEFDEYKFDFHGSKFKSKSKNKRESEKKEDLRRDLTQIDQTSLKSKESQQTINKKGNLKDGPLVNAERLAKTIKDKFVVCTPDERSSVGKKLRTPTFNQLTGPYHEPFCLDIYVSKGSVRACVVHRVTSKVVIVAHSISKDMKFELGSTKSVAAATAVGKVLAQRALEDDIHDVIYTPRKGDKLEGKLQVVLQAIINNGLNVKLKLKQRNPNKAIGRP
ncbi:uncharacterized protein LOC141619195 isoform X1 [Silene latifolia]|uniref:uncharacterized protein LOC141619195 isoform X1 n=1 Tax=Silene latifolia TaxID=37657 RepID=UPI003D772B0D